MVWLQEALAWLWIQVKICQHWRQSGFRPPWDQGLGPAVFPVGEEEGLG